MILYEYECLNCQAKFQKDISSLNTQISCPGCSGKEVKKLWAIVPNTLKEAKTCSKKCGGCRRCSVLNQGN